LKGFEPNELTDPPGTPRVRSASSPDC
jgi:hypothetical protein